VTTQAIWALIGSGAILIAAIGSSVAVVVGRDRHKGVVVGLSVAVFILMLAYFHFAARPPSCIAGQNC
jgi:hypothetical protein